MSLAVLTCLVGLSAYAQVKQTRNVGSFSGVDAGGALNVFIKQGATPSVVVETDQDLQDHIITEVKGGVLHIYREHQFKWNNWGRKKINVYITCTELNSLDVSGATDLKGESAFIADNFHLKASGASDVTISISAKKLSADASGASNVRLSGRADSQYIHVSGASDYEAFSLQSKQANVEASGSSDAQIAVDEDLTANVSGASDVTYKGNPKIRNVQTSGSSSIRKTS